MEDEDEEYEHSDYNLNGEDWYVMPSDWFKLLNLPEIRNTE